MLGQSKHLHSQSPLIPTGLWVTYSPSIPPSKACPASPLSQSKVTLVPSIFLAVSVQDNSVLHLSNVPTH